MEVTQSYWWSVWESNVIKCWDCSGSKGWAPSCMSLLQVAFSQTILQPQVHKKALLVRLQNGLLFSIVISNNMIYNSWVFYSKKKAPSVCLCLLFRCAVVCGKKKCSGYQVTLIHISWMWRITCFWRSFTCFSVRFFTLKWKNMD